MIARLHNLVGDKPLVATGIDAGDTTPEDLDRDTPHDLGDRLTAVFSAGCAGALVSAPLPSPDTVPTAGTDADTTGSHVGSESVWNVVREAYVATPFAAGIAWPRVSVIVCSFNGAATIRDTLEGLSAIRYPAGKR